MRIGAVFIPFILLASALALNPHPASALTSVSDDILTIAPTTPKAYQPVTVSINPAEIAPGGSVRWFVKGIELTNDANARSITINTGAMAEETKVEALIDTAGAGEKRVTASIVPVRIDLIVTANSRVPHFYLGRALPGKESSVSVQALVFGDNSGPYSYTWRVNGQDQTNSIGQNNSQVSFKPGLDQTMTVEVEVRNRAGQMVAEDRVFIPLVEPEIHFYESNPLRGLIPNTLKSPYYLLSDEITLRGEPYYFSGQPEQFSIKWGIDQTEVAGDEYPLDLSLVKTLETGRTMVSLDIINRNSYLERAESELEINY